MATPLEKVIGIGPATAKQLAENGITSAEDLAARQVEEIAAVHGFSTIRATQVIAAARDLFVLVPVVANDEQQPPAPETVIKEKKSKPGKAKKADRKKEKKSEKPLKKDKKKDQDKKTKDSKKKGKNKGKKAKK